MVVYNARDFAHEEDLWIGDLRDGSVGLAYKAPETTGKKVEIWWPQLAAGALYWIEYTHNGIDVSYPTASWIVRRMDVATARITIVAQGKMPRFGGQKYPERIRWDGHRLAAVVALPDDSWRIEIWDTRGTVTAALPVPGSPYDMALLGDAVLFTAGTPYPPSDSIGKMHTYVWQISAKQATEVGSGAFQVAGCDGLAAWISDPVASRDSTGYPVLQRVFSAAPPYTSALGLSPEPSESGTSGADYVACGSGTLAWLEVDGPRGTTGWDTLTVWQPGWSGPVQIQTAGGPYGFTIKGGWLAWIEYNDEMDQGRLRGIPLSLIPGWHG
jgi:hypothetical protein